MRTATKTHHERENEEAERLIKPLPKERPPRHDKERNRVKDPDIDRDPDLSKHDPDLSMNYKDIGGSIYSYDKTAHEFPTEEALKAYLKAHPDADPRNHSVVEQEDEEAKTTDLEKKEQRSGEVAPEAAVPADAKAISHWKSRPPEEVQAFIDGLKSLPQDARLDDVLKNIDPDTVAEVRRNLGKNVKTVGGLANWLSQAAKGELDGLLQKKPKPKKHPKVDLETDTPPEEMAPDLQEPLPDLEKPVEDPTPEPEVPPFKEEPAAEVPPSGDAPTVPPEEGKKEEDVYNPDGKGKNKKPSRWEDQSNSKYGIPRPTRRPRTKEDEVEANALIDENFPEHMAHDVRMLAFHPDDIASFVTVYNELANVPLDPKKIGAAYETDRAHVKPPQTWPDPKTGAPVPFNQLEPKDQAEAYRQHQIQVLALSMAAEQQLGAQLAEEHGIPEEVARVLATAQLRGAAEPELDEDEVKKLGPSYKSPAAVKMFESAIDLISKEGDVPHFSPKTIQKIMGSMSRSGRAVAAAYFQAVDLFNANTQVSVSQDAESFAKSVAAQKKELQERAKIYGDAANPDNGYTTFKVQALARLRKKAPEKFAEVRKILVGDEVASYEKDHAKWEKDHAAWKKRKEKAESSPGYRDSGKPFDEEPPVEPQKPGSYADHKLIPEGGGPALVSDVLSRITGQKPEKPGLLKKVVDRFRGPDLEKKPKEKDKKEEREKRPVDYAYDESEWEEDDEEDDGDGYEAPTKKVKPGKKSPSKKKKKDSPKEKTANSSYADSYSMNRAAVYHGIEPKFYQEKGVYDYRRRELTAADQSQLVKAALEWMKTADICKNAMEPHRIALDYAIYTSAFNGHVDAPTYNAILESMRSK